MYERDGTLKQIYSSGTDSLIELTGQGNGAGGVGNAGRESVDMTIEIQNPNNSLADPRMSWRASWLDGGGRSYFAWGGAQNVALPSTDSFRLEWTTGNSVSGTVSVYEELIT